MKLSLLRSDVLLRFFIPNGDGEYDTYEIQNPRFVVPEVSDTVGFDFLDGLFVVDHREIAYGSNLTVVGLTLSTEEE